MKKVFPTFLKAFLLILLFLIFQILSSYLLEMFFSKIGIKNYILKLILDSSITLSIFILLLFKLSKENFKTLFPLKKISTKEFFLVILISISFVVFSSEIENWINHFFPSILKFQELINTLFDLNSPVLTFFLLCILAPVTEEFIFRGVIFNGFQKNYSIITTILLTAFLFAFMHLNPAQFFPAFLFGIIAGWIFYNSENLSLTILFHGVSNFISYIVLMKFFPWEIEGFSTFPNTIDQEFEPFSVFFSSYIILNFGIYFLYKLKR